MPAVVRGAHSEKWFFTLFCSIDSEERRAGVDKIAYIRGRGYKTQGDLPVRPRKQQKSTKMHNLFCRS